MRSALLSASLQQGIIMVLAGFLLDGGSTGQVCSYAVVAFWGGVAVILCRRASVPTKSDLALVRGGFIVLCVLSFFVAYGIWYLKGY